MDHLRLSRDLSSRSTNEPEAEQGFAGRLKTCLLALTLVIAPPIALAACALGDYVFNDVEAPAMDAARLSSEMPDAGSASQSLRVPAAPPRTRD